MVLLVLFAFVAGAGTAITPCVLPVLPAILSASATGGRRRPAGIILGLSVTFTVTIVGLASVIDGVGLAQGVVRTIAVVVLLVFGFALIWPALGDRLEAPLSRLARFGPRDAGDGFWSGLPVGAALGFVYAPCAGPILAAVISVAATNGATGRIVAIALGYAAGSALVLGLLAYGGRRVFDRIRRAGRGPVVQRALGVVLVLTAIAVATNLDVRFQTALANDFPSFLTNPTHGLERSHAVESRLARLRGRSRFDLGGRAPDTKRVASSLPVLGTAPDFAGGGRWFNSRPLNLSQLRGRVVLVDFWTYTCINCIRTLPHVRAWANRYRRDGLTVVGVHTPEFGFEHEAKNVETAIRSNRLSYPVVQDNDYATWDAWGNQYWPAKYLIDARGRVRYTHFGEGDYGKTEDAIRMLLRERGDGSLGGATRARAVTPSNAPLTPETYLGAEKAQGFAGTPPYPGRHRYPVAGKLDTNAFALTGIWRVGREAATATPGARLDAETVARRVYLVLGSRGGTPRRVRVLLDGHAAGKGEAGADVRGGVLTVTGQRLYELIDLPRVGQHRLTLLPEDGVSAYAFTFG